MKKKSTSKTVKMAPIERDKSDKAYSRATGMKRGSRGKSRGY